MKPFIVRLNSTGIACIVSVHTSLSFLIDSPLVLFDLGLFVIAEYIKALHFRLKLNGKYVDDLPIKQGNVSQR